MSPQLAADSRSFVEYIDDLIAEHKGPLRVMAETDAKLYDRARDLGRSYSLVPLHKHEIEDDSISGCMQVITKIAARLIAANAEHWSNHDASKPVALLGYLIAERNHLRALVMAQNTQSMASMFQVAAE